MTELFGAAKREAEAEVAVTKTCVKRDNGDTDQTLLLFSNKRRKRDILYDAFNELPDDILVKILSCLTIKEAVCTSILSSRWRYLWKNFTGVLDFEDALTMEDLRSSWGLGSEPLDVERNKFASWVNYVLRSLYSPTMEGLKICFDIVSDDDIGNWIKFAIERRVQRLELDFSRGPCRTWDSIRQYNFSSHVDDCSSFRSLTALCLAYVDVTGEAIEKLLSYCPFLEVLSVTRCFCVKSLKVSGPSLKLRYLRLKLLDSLEDLTIDAANLTSFEVRGSDITVSFVNVPTLAEISLIGGCSIYFVHNIDQFSSLLLQLQTLKLFLGGPEAPEAVPYNIPKLENLRHLEMCIQVNDDDSFLPCAAFLEACPSLHKFTLKLTRVEPSSGLVRTVKDHPYISLGNLSIRVVEVFGFEGRTTDTEFLICLIANAKLLEKITVDPCKYYYLGTPKELWYRETQRYLSFRKRALKLAEKFLLWEFVIP